jgi:hypothetical protein
MNRRLILVAELYAFGSVPFIGFLLTPLVLIICGWRWLGYYVAITSIPQLVYLAAFPTLADSIWTSSRNFALSQVRVIQMQGIGSKAGIQAFESLKLAMLSVLGLDIGLFVAVFGSFIFSYFYLKKIIRTRCYSEIWQKGKALE